MLIPKRLMLLYKSTSTSQVAAFIIGDSAPKRRVSIKNELLRGEQLRRGIFASAAAAGILLLIGTQPGCGGYGGGSGSTTPVSGLTERAFVTSQNGPTPLDVVDASKDQFTASTVTLGGSSPALMVPGANNTTLVFNANNNGISVVDNIKEAVVTMLGTTDCTAGTVSCELQLPGPTESMTESSDAKFIYAAIPSTSQVAYVDLTVNPFKINSIPATAGNCTTGTNCVPGAHRLVLSHSNAKLLVFNELLSNQFEVINTSDKTVQTVTNASLDHPIYGVFSSDDSKAYILSCGAECGGKQASVAVLDMTSLTIGQTVNVDAATIAASDSSNLYIAGSNPASAGAGSATVLPIPALTGAKQIKIGDGFHQVVSLFQSKFIVGARTCTTGCLSIVDPAAGTAIVDSPKGDVTSIAPITPRSVFYDTEGGELHVYDVSNGSEHLNNGTLVLDVVGKASSVLYVGPKM